MKNKKQVKNFNNKLLLSGVTGNTNTTSIVSLGKMTTSVTTLKEGYFTDNFNSYYLDKNMVKHYFIDKKIIKDEK